MSTGAASTKIDDVAARAGVSLTTVSHVLNGKGRVSPQTRRRVLAVAADLGYSANMHARGLAGGRSSIVAIQVSGYGDKTLVPGSSYFQQLLNGVSAAALERGLALVVAPPTATSTDLRRLPAEGAIIVDPTGKESIREVMSDRGAPVVTTGRIANDSALTYDCVDNDHRGATKKALDHLWNSGYRRPALLTTARALSYSIDAIAAYEEWADGRETPRHVYTVPETSVGAAERVVRKVLRDVNGPDAFYATTDDLALGVLLGTRSMNLAIPDDIGLVAGTDAPALQTATPTVTSLSLHPSRIGAEAVGLLVARLDGEQSGPARLLRVPTRLTPRGSTRRTTRL